MKRSVVNSVFVISLWLSCPSLVALNPVVYADISEEAQDAAVSFDGINAFVGAILNHTKYLAGTPSSYEDTKSPFNNAGASLGVNYNKSFRRGILVGVNAGVDITPRDKKDSEWDHLNAAYAKDMTAKYVGGGKTGKLETESITPNCGVRVGYMMPKYRLALFLKVGVSKLKATYTYSQLGKSVCDIAFSKLVPSIGVGVERKFAPKIGVAVEANIAQKKSAITGQDGSAHDIRVSRTDLKVMGIYSMSTKK